MKKQVLIIIIILIFNQILLSQESGISRLSISEAKEYAINHNKQLRNVRADTDIARHRYWEALSQGLPQVSANLDYTNFFNYEMEFGMMGGDDIDLSHLSPEYQQIMGMIMSMFSGPGTIKMQNQSTAQLQFSQLIFSGQYIAGIQIAKIAQILADKNVDRTEIEIKESVTSSYYMALITEESIKVLDNNLNNLEETKKQTKALLNAGMLEPIDIDQIQMSITMLENSKRAMLRNLELSYNILRIQLGLEKHEEIILTDKLDNILENVNVESLILQDFILQQNIDYQLLETQQKMTEKMIDMERWNYAPSIVAAYSYNEKILTTEFDMNPRHLLTFRMSVPIFSSGLRKSRVDQKRIELYQIQNTREILQDQLLMQEKQLRYNLISAHEQYESQKQNVELAKRIYEHTERKFRHGVASSLDLTQANSNYLQAETNYISAVMELLMAKLSFDKLLNKI